MNAASLLTTLFAFAVGMWVHRRYLKDQNVAVIIAGTLAFGEIFKWVTGIETFPLQIFKKTRVGSDIDTTLDKTTRGLTL
jgi:hypothetical protein